MSFIRTSRPLRYLLGILLVVLLLGGCFLISRAALTATRSLGQPLAQFWHDYFGEPILAFILRIFSLVDGNLILTLSVLALLYLILTRLGFSWLISRPMQLSSSQFAKVNPTQQQNVSLEAIHSKLRHLFADDIEKIAYYERRFSQSSTDEKGRNPLLLGCGGCLFSITWTVLFFPLRILIALAIYLAMLALFTDHNALEAVVVPAGLIGSGLEVQPPLASTLFGEDLTGRSLLLTLLLGLSQLAYWLPANVSISGRTFPRPADVGGLGLFVGELILIYFFVPGLLVLFLLLFTIISLIFSFANRFFLRPSILQMRGRRARRTSA